MSELRIYFSAAWRDSATPCPWALCDDRGGMQQSGVSPLANLPKGHDCVAIIAADRVLNIPAMLPPGNRRRLQSLLPFVAEEFTLSDPEENHVVPGDTLADGRRMLAVVDKQWLQRIVSAAQQAKLSLRRMLVESAMPTATAESWTLVWDGQGGFVKTGAAGAVALDAGDAQAMPVLLRMSLDGAVQIPKKIEFKFRHDTPAELRTMPQWADLSVPLVAGSDWDWRRAPVADTALNLLWGEFTPRAKLQEWWPRLRPAVWLLLAVLAIETVGSNVQWAQLVYEKNQQTKNMQRIFRATFGEAVTLVNAPLQMQRNLAEARHAAGVEDSGDYLSLLNAAGMALAALPGGSVVAMHYESGRLDIDIRLPKKADFARLQKTLLDSGLGVRMGEVRDLGNAAETRVTLLPEGMS